MGQVRHHQAMGRASRRDWVFPQFATDQFAINAIVGQGEQFLGGHEGRRRGHGKILSDPMNRSCIVVE
jgi:hypothetical protein